jgi:hypothetical protein
MKRGLSVVPTEPAETCAGSRAYLEHVRFHRAVASLLKIYADWYSVDAGANQPPDYVTLERMRNRTI